MRDKLGFEIPQHIQELWEESDKIGHELSRGIHQIKMVVQKGIKNRDLAFREINQSTVYDLENLWRELLLIIPYAVCPICEADERRDVCVGCRGRGFLSKFRYERCVPQNIKAPRLERLARAG